MSITGDGAIYSGTLGNPTIAPFIAGAPGGSAVGLKIRKGKLYVAGGATGLIKVYDLTTKALVASFDTGAGGFLNDLVVTGNGDVFVTDSFRPTLWHVTAAQVAAGTGTPQALDVSGVDRVHGRGVQPERHRREGPPHADPRADEHRPAVARQAHQDERRDPEDQRDRRASRCPAATA